MKDGKGPAILNAGPFPLPDHVKPGSVAYHDILTFFIIFLNCSFPFFRNRFNLFLAAVIIRTSFILVYSRAFICVYYITYFESGCQFLACQPGGIKARRTSEVTP